MGRLAEIFSYPVVQALVTQGANIAGQIYLSSLSASKMSPNERMVQRLDEMIKELDERLKHLKEMDKDVPRRASEEEKLTPEQRFATAPSSRNKADKNAHIGTNLNDHSNAPANSPSEKKQDVGSACLPCTRAHLITVAGTLKEAVRFARGEGGMKDKEVQDRLDAALEELSVMERFDLAPEKLRGVSDNERKAIEAVLPDIRRLRQSLAKGVQKLEELEELAAEAAEVYKRAREVSTESGEQEIDWEQVKREIIEEEKDEKGGE